MKHKKRRMHLYIEEIHAVKGADFAGSGCLEFGFLDTIRKTRPSPVSIFYSHFVSASETSKISV